MVAIYGIVWSLWLGDLSRAAINIGYKAFANQPCGTTEYKIMHDEWLQGMYFYFYFITPFSTHPRYYSQRVVKVELVILATTLGDTAEKR